MSSREGFFLEVFAPSSFPLQPRRWELRPMIDSKVRSQASQMNLPSAFCFGGPVAPPRKRLPQAAQSDPGPLGPGDLPFASSVWHWHHSQRHLPPSQYRWWPASPSALSKIFRHRGHMCFFTASAFRTVCADSSCLGAGTKRFLGRNLEAHEVQRARVCCSTTGSFPEESDGGGCEFVAAGASHQSHCELRPVQTHW